MFSTVSKKERFSFYSHLVPAFFAVAATVYLAAYAAVSWQDRVVALIYGLSMIFLFAASSLYHAKKTGENGRGFYRRLDHFAIYMMIAGSYTAIGWLYLPQTLFIIIISLQWLMVLAGVYFKFVRMNTHRLVSTAIYLAMGWMIIFTIKPVVTAMGIEEFMLLIAGGISYSVGAFFYAVKKPVLIPERFGFHEIFHIFIVGGAFFHFLVVLHGFGR